MAHSEVLTDEQKKLMETMLKNGTTIPDIAKALNVSIRTVKSAMPPDPLYDDAPRPTTHAERCPVCQGDGYINSGPMITNFDTGIAHHMYVSPCGACRGLGFVYVPEIPVEDKKEKMSKEDLLVSILVDLNILHEDYPVTTEEKQKILKAQSILEELNIEYHKKSE